LESGFALLITLKKALEKARKRLLL